MVYITNYTLGKLVKSFKGQEQITHEFFFNQIYGDSRLFFFFNKFELNYLNNFRMFLKDTEECFDYFSQVPPDEDSQTYVNEYRRRLVYHLTSECELLHKDFVGFVIPEEVKTAKKVKKLRDWFKENNIIEKYMTGELKADKIIFKYNTGFAPKNGLKPLVENYNLIVEKNNSGSERLIGQFSIDEFKSKVDIIVNKIYKLVVTEELERVAMFDWMRNKSNSEIMDKLQDLIGESRFNALGIGFIKSFWKEHYGYKRELISLLLTYFKWTYKANQKEYNVITLENFGLSECVRCKKLYILDKLGIDNNKNDILRDY